VRRLCVPFLVGSGVASVRTAGASVLWAQRGDASIRGINEGVGWIFHAGLSPSCSGCEPPTLSKIITIHASTSGLKNTSGRVGVYR
jgi:hypothetical protein